MLADAFELYANAYERSILLRDFYGKEVALFSTAGKGKSAATVSDADKDNLRKGLSGVLQGVDTERKKRTLAAVKSNLDLVCV